MNHPYLDTKTYFLQFPRARPNFSCPHAHTQKKKRFTFKNNKSKHQTPSVSNTTREENNEKIVFPFWAVRRSLLRNLISEPDRFSWIVCPRCALCAHRNSKPSSLLKSHSKTSLGPNKTKTTPCVGSFHGNLMNLKVVRATNGVSFYRGLRLLRFLWQRIFFASRIGCPLKH